MGDRSFRRLNKAMNQMLGSKCDKKPPPKKEKVTEKVGEKAPDIESQLHNQLEFLAGYRKVLHERDFTPKRDDRKKKPGTNTSDDDVIFVSTEKDSKNTSSKRKYDERGRASEKEGSKESSSEKRPRKSGVDQDYKGIDFLSLHKRQTDVLDRTKSDYYCKLCDAHMNNYDMWQMHIVGKRHQKSLKKEAANTIDSGAKTDVSIQWQLSKALEQEKRTVVGLDFMEEIWKTEEGPPIYHCYLCRSPMNAEAVVDHILTTKHRMNYLREVDPREAAMLEEMTLKKFAMDSIIAEKAGNSENRRGRGSIKVKKSYKPGASKPEKANGDVEPRRNDRSDSSPSEKRVRKGRRERAEARFEESRSMDISQSMRRETMRDPVDVGVRNCEFPYAERRERVYHEEQDDLFFRSFVNGSRGTTLPSSQAQGTLVSHRQASVAAPISAPITTPITTPVAAPVAAPVTVTVDQVIPQLDIFKQLRLLDNSDKILALKELQNPNISTMSEAEEVNAVIKSLTACLMLFNIKQKSPNVNLIAAGDVLQPTVEKTRNIFEELQQALNTIRMVENSKQNTNPGNNPGGAQPDVKKTLAELSQWNEQYKADQTPVVQSYVPAAVKKSENVLSQNPTSKAPITSQAPPLNSMAPAEGNNYWYKMASTHVSASLPKEPATSKPAESNVGYTTHLPIVKKSSSPVPESLYHGNHSQVSSASNTQLFTRTVPMQKSYPNTSNWEGQKNYETYSFRY